jgi:hypothetical protein
MNLPTFTLDASTPAWAVSLIQSEQQANINIYSQGWQGFQNAITNWLASNVALRNASADPTNYTPTGFSGIVPQLQVVNWDPTSNTETTTYWTDTTLVTPSMPPYVPPAPANTDPGKIATGTPGVDPSLTSFEVAVMQYLMKIATKLGA